MFVCILCTVFYVLSYGVINDDDYVVVRTLNFDFRF